MRHNDFDKTRASIRYWQLGRNYFVASAAMNFAEQVHVGTRKDGVTPEFSHQVAQANYARTLDTLMMEPEFTLATVWLHDTVEDCATVTQDQILDQFGHAISGAVELMTNQIKGAKKPVADYYAAMANCPIASLAKGIDRIHNVSTMVGVFGPAKMISYVNETRTYILPMLKAARKNWPQQEAAYQNIKTMLLVQLDILQAMLPQDAQ